MNKKAWIIIVLATILASVAANIIIDKMPRPLASKEQDAVNEKPIINEETVEPVEETTQEEEKEEVTAPKPQNQLQSTSVSPQKVIKKDVQKSNNEEKEITLQASVETKKEVQPVVEPSVIEDSGNLIVLKEFKSQNGYKYIFTPARYKSKQY